MGFVLIVVIFLALAKIQASQKEDVLKANIDIGASNYYLSAILNSKLTADLGTGDKSYLVHDLIAPARFKDSPERKLLESYINLTINSLNIPGERGIACTEISITYLNKDVVGGDTIFNLFDSSEATRGSNQCSSPSSSKNRETYTFPINNKEKAIITMRVVNV